MSGLVDFLTARLADDERMALAAAPDSWKVDGSWKADTWTNDKGREFLIIADHFNMPPAIVIQHRASADHIANYDPARALREVRAKQRIIAEHPILTAWSVCTRCSDFSEHGGEPLRKVPGPCNTLRLLALPYAQHPDYQQEWAV